MSEQIDNDQMRAAFREGMLATPYIEGLGVRVERWDPDGVVLRLPFEEALTNDGRFYHGGAIAALVDTAGASAVWAGHDFSKGMRAATVSMTVNYTGAVERDDLIGNAVCVKRGRDLAFSEIKITGADGTLVATGSLVYRIVA